MRMTLDTSRWRSSSTYDYVDGLVAADLAWEWLRRNADYQRDYAEIERGVVDPQRYRDLVRARWGLQFRSPSNAQRHRNHSLLGAGGRSGHSHPHSASADTGLAECCAA
ncbi:transcriptional regulator domain-containing protein [Pelagibacterium sp. 26DY04]|uniref:transcriptional regulator domain-containing protein n=1 Tax=Pelagibacterium sp. 26DY04 TaxID=2967130 RepID=UPI0035BEB660